MDLNTTNETETKQTTKQTNKILFGEYAASGSEVVVYICIMTFGGRTGATLEEGGQRFLF